MSINEDLGKGGCKITPSARRGIHSQDQVFSNRGAMARYGDDSSSDEECPEHRNMGTDEVDNVMSKFSHSSSPLVMRKAKRNSMTPPDEQHTDDCDDNALTKSLPATLPSYSNCRDDRDDWSLSFGNQLNNSAESTLTPRSRGNRTDSRNSSFHSRSPNISPSLNQSRTNHRKQENHKEGTIFMSIIALLSIFSYAYYYDLFYSTFDSVHDKYDELRFHRDLSQLGAKYKVDDNSVLQLQAGISTIFKREDTSCFIFVYNSMREDFDEIDFDGFVNNVASNTAKFLRNDTTTVEHVVVEGSDLNMRSHTQLVKAYREDIARTGVLLIRDVEHVPSPLAMAFHYYCDEYNPLVKKSAIFFTLNTAKCHNAGEKSSHASVEKCLKKKWDTVPPDNIGPLLTRVVSVLVDVTNH